MAEVSEQVRIIIGQIGHPVCAGRIARHGARLGLGVLMVAQAVGVVEVRVSGPPDLLDAMDRAARWGRARFGLSGSSGVCCCDLSAGECFIAGHCRGWVW